MPEGDRDVTQLLHSWQAGDQSALDELLPLVYDELRSIARHHLRRESGSTLQATALANEAYLKMRSMNQMHFVDRQHFFSLASRAMRRFLIDHARRKKAAKRGGPDVSITLAEGVAASKGQEPDVLALDVALTRLEGTDERAARVVEMRYFVGLTLQEVAEVLSVSLSSAKRDWKFAKAFLKRELERA